jgi:hypothetical protein
MGIYRPAPEELIQNAEKSQIQGFHCALFVIKEKLETTYTSSKYKNSKVN